MKKFLISGLILLTAVAVGCGGKKQGGTPNPEPKPEPPKPVVTTNGAVETAVLKVVADVVVAEDGITMTIQQSAFSVFGPKGKEEKRPIIGLEKLASTGATKAQLDLEIQAGKNSAKAELVAGKDQALELKKSDPLKLEDLLETPFFKVVAKNLKAEYLVEKEIAFPIPAFGVSNKTEKKDLTVDELKTAISNVGLTINKKAAAGVIGHVYRPDSKVSESALMKNVRCFLEFQPDPKKPETQEAKIIDLEKKEISTKAIEDSIKDLPVISKADAWITCENAGIEIIGAAAKKKEFGFIIQVRTKFPGGLTVEEKEVTQ